MSDPRISVVVATYNRPNHLHAAIESIAAQTLRSFEILVVNDGGTPVSGLPAQARLLTHSERRGPAAARNTALREACGEFIAYLDDDDRFLPHHLQTLLSAIEANGADVVYSDHAKVSGRSEPGAIREVERSAQANPDFDPERITLENFIPLNCILHRRACIERAGMFDEAMVALEDWDLWFRISREFRFVHVPELTCEVWRYSDEGSITTTHGSGFAWAALNGLYKYPALVPGRPDLAELYASKAAEALEHLKVSMLQLWTAGQQNLEGIFFFHSAAEVYHRLGELEEFYGTHHSRFRELKGLLLAHRGEFAPACEHLREALTFDSSNASAATILSILENAAR